MRKPAPQFCPSISLRSRAPNQHSLSYESLNKNTKLHNRMETIQCFACECHMYDIICMYICHMTSLLGHVVGVSSMQGGSGNRFASSKPWLPTQRCRGRQRGTMVRLPETCRLPPTLRCAAPIGSCSDLVYATRFLDMFSCEMCVPFPALLATISFITWWILIASDYCAVGGGNLRQC